jgi:hypothetical protein
LLLLRRQHILTKRFQPFLLKFRAMVMVVEMTQASQL